MISFTVDSRVLLATITALVAFGLWYNAWVAGLVHTGRDRGYLSLIVAAGVAVTIAGVALIAGWQVALIVLLAFVASGTPMILGSIRRYVDARAADEARARHDARRALQ